MIGSDYTGCLVIGLINTSITLWCQNQLKYLNETSLLYQISDITVVEVTI